MPSDDLTRAVEAILSLPNGAETSVVSVDLEEAISRTSHASVIVTASHLDAAPLLGGRAVLTLRAPRVTREWTLVLGSVSLEEEKSDARRYRLDLFDPLWLLGLTKNTRKFRHQTTQQIVTRVLADRGLECAWQLVGRSPKRGWAAQYRETDLAFVSRLLEHDGVYFTADERGRVVLGDCSTDADPLPEPMAPALIEKHGAATGDVGGVFELAHGRRVRSGTATLNDYNWKTRDVRLMVSRSAAEDADLEVYDYLTGYRDPERGAELARLRLEELRVGSVYATGCSNLCSFAPARCFSLPAEAAPDFDAGYLLVRVVHRYRNAAHAASDEAPESYINEFEAIPKKQPYRPALVTPWPEVAGNHTAIVRGPAGEEIHTDEHGRFKAQLHWDREARSVDKDSRWMRMMQEASSSIALARAGWEVALGYIGGDPDRPVGLGRLINGQMAPTYGQPANKTVMAMQSPSSPVSGGFNELKLGDTATDMAFFMRAERNMDTMVKNDQSETVGRDDLHVVGANHATTVGGQQALTIGGNATLTINESYALDLAGARDKTVGGGERADVAEADALTVGGSDKETVAGVRLTITGSIGPPNIKAVAKSKIPSPLGAAKGAISGGFSGGVGGALKSLVPSPPSLSDLAGSMIQGGIYRSAKAVFSRMVGAAQLSVAVDDISSATKGIHSEIVGGAKLTIAGEHISTSTKGALVTTVGGAIVRESAAAMSDATSVSSISAGAAIVATATKSLTVVGATTTFSAGSATLSGEGATIDMSAGSITLTGDVMLVASGSITYEGTPIT